MKYITKYQLNGRNRKLVLSYQRHGETVVHYTSPVVNPKDKPPGTKPNLAKFDEVLDSELRNARRNKEGIAPPPGTCNRNNGYQKPVENLDNV